ncbi:MAG: hypothetical protein KF791_03090 [Verrucomicrobiae bacterium]|nr:hypothetical protein [Verrucomicrobiae bacterium]
MSPARDQMWKLVTALVLLAGAAGLVWKFVRSNEGVSEKAFFYDLSERRLFVAERGLVPPIRGVNDAVEDGVRAVVVSTNGRPDDRRTWTIAYLETSTPELKRQLDAARAAGTAPELGRTAAQAMRLVRRPGDAEWVSLASPEGERIVTEWVTAGTGDRPPVVCTP